MVQDGCPPSSQILILHVFGNNCLKCWPNPGISHFSEQQFLFPTFFLYPNQTRSLHNSFLSYANLTLTGITVRLCLDIKKKVGNTWFAAHLFQWKNVR